MQIPVHCDLCPRRCGADRTRGKGRCQGGNQVTVARAALHHWEEPCISGSRGSGTVFFSGCSLQCCYCQNWHISSEGFGRPVSIRQLADIFLDLQSQGAHNINLVTPGHWAPWVVEALDQARSRGLTLPIVCNTSSYETVETVKLLARHVTVWLADIKYVSSRLSGEYSAAPDYFEAAEKAIGRMLQLAGPPVMGPDGTLQRGVILRHLALPGALADSKAVLQWMAGLPAGSFIPSLMSQYTPFYKAAEHKALGRRISSWEYRQVVNTAVDLGLCEGYMQQKSSAKEEYTPAFDLTGVPESYCE